MNRGLWAGIICLAAGCKTTPPTPPPEPVVPPMDVNGVPVVFHDLRPAWEKQPLAGPVTLYSLGRITPDPWAELARETGAAVAAMPEKPERVEVFVASYRLVGRKEPTRRPDPSENVRPAGQRIQYDTARAATAAGDTKSARAAGSGVASQGLWDALGLSDKREDPDSPENPLDDHPLGASCKIRAAVRLTFPGGREQVVDLKAIATGENVSGTKYVGEALADAVKGAVRQSGFQFRQAVGAPG